MADANVGLFDRFIGRAQSAAGRLRVRSALNPMLWLCAIVSLPLFAGAWLAKGIEPLATILTYVAAAPVVVTCCLAVYFALFRPEKLQSEEYQIRHEAIELIKQKGVQIEVAPSSLEAITNPLRQLPPPARGGR
jgi:hypothetical protein